MSETARPVNPRIVYLALVAVLLAACGRGGGESVAVVRHLLLAAGALPVGSPSTCGLDDDTRPARPCPALVIMPTESRVVATDQPLERVITLEPPFVTLDSAPPSQL